MFTSKLCNFKCIYCILIFIRKCTTTKDTKVLHFYVNNITPLPYYLFVSWFIYLFILVLKNLPHFPEEEGIVMYSTYSVLFWIRELCSQPLRYFYSFIYVYLHIRKSNSLKIGDEYVTLFKSIQFLFSFIAKWKTSHDKRVYSPITGERFFFSFSTIQFMRRKLH